MLHREGQVRFGLTKKKKKERGDIYRGIIQHGLNGECENEEPQSTITDQQFHSAAVEK